MSQDVNVTYGIWDQIAGSWFQLHDEILKEWSKFTDSDVTLIKGRKDNLVGKIQHRYGIAKEEANNQADKWAAGRTA